MLFCVFGDWLDGEEVVTEGLGVGFLLVKVENTVNENN